MAVPVGPALAKRLKQPFDGGSRWKPAHPQWLFDPYYLYVRACVALAQMPAHGRPIVTGGTREALSAYERSLERERRGAPG